MKKEYKILLLLCFLLIQSCATQIASILPNRPSNAFDDDLEHASLEFKQGWKDGCEVGMASGSNTFYKTFYRQNKVDGYKIANSPDYKAAWGNAFWFCYRYDFIKQKSSIWGSIMKGYE